MRLSGATVLVTGASGGLGAAISETLAARGAKLVLSGRRAEELGRLAARTGGRVVLADLAARADVDRLAAEARDVDVLVANAALPATGRLVGYEPDSLDRVLDVNLRAPMLLARAFAGPMIDAGRGHLVFIASLSGMVASPGSSLYAATKFGLRGFAHGLRQDLAGSGVGVSLVTPGFVRDAGMYADTGVRLPPGVGTATASQVAAAVVRAVERNRDEILVAPAMIRVGARLGALAPGVAARIQRLAGAHRVSAELAAAQAAKR